jgi:dihydrofolate reductase
VSSASTQLERASDPVAVRQMKAAADRDLTIGGPRLAGLALEAGLVDEFQLFVAPVVVGGGTRFFPNGVRLDLELLDEHRFGTVSFTFDTARGDASPRHTVMTTFPRACPDSR